MISLFSICLLFAEQKYKIIDLKIPDAIYSEATGLNNHGQVCGKYINSKRESALFFWDPSSGFEDIELSSVHGKVCINDNGLIACAASKGIYVWEKCSGLELVVAAEQLRLVDFSDSGQILYQDNNERKLFLLDKGISFEMANFSEAKINSAEELFGYEKQNNNIQLKHQKAGSCTEIFFYKGRFAHIAFNNSGVAVGHFDTCHGNRYGFIWSPEKGFALLDDFYPTCLNDNGDMVGTIDDHKFFPFIQKNGERLNINKMLGLEFDPSSPWSFVESISAINNEGQMVGTAYKDYSRDRYAVLISPLR